jgi:hypothetical protein
MQRMVVGAERSEVSSGTGFQLDMMVRRLRSFPEAARSRNSRCSYGDVWSLSSPVPMIVARRVVRMTFEIEKHDGPFELFRTPNGAFWIPEQTSIR